MLNVGLFRGALLVYESLLPRLVLHVLGVRLADDWRYQTAILLLWSVPAYLICEIVTTSLQFKMAHRMVPPPPQPSSPPAPSSGGGDSGSTAGGPGVASSGSGAAGPGDGGALAHGAGGAPRGEVADANGEGLVFRLTSMAYTRLIYLAFVVQIRLLCGLPYVGTLVAMVLSALLHAYDAFEFTWEHQGYGVAERFALIEHVRARAPARSTARLTRIPSGDAADRVASGQPSGRHTLALRAKTGTPLPLTPDPSPHPHPAPSSRPPPV